MFTACSTATLSYNAGPVKTQYLNVGDPLASSISYTHSYGVFAISTAGCPIKYSIAIQDTTSKAVSPLFASTLSKVPDSSVDVIVGPSKDTTLAANSPYILTLTAEPVHNPASTKLDTLNIKVINTPISCSGLTVASSQESNKFYQIPNLPQEIHSLTPFIFSNNEPQANAFPCFTMSLMDSTGLNQLPSMTPDSIINFDFTTDFTL